MALNHKKNIRSQKLHHGPFKNWRQGKCSISCQISDWSFALLILFYKIFRQTFAWVWSLWRMATSSIWFNFRPRTHSSWSGADPSCSTKFEGFFFFLFSFNLLFQLLRLKIQIKALRKPKYIICILIGTFRNIN